MKRKALALAIAICLLFAAVPGLVGFIEARPGPQDANSLGQYLPPDAVKHLKILGYRTPAQFVAFASSNREMLDRELAPHLTPQQINEALQQMQPVIRQIRWRPVFPSEQSLGLILEQPVQIVSWQELLARYGAVSVSYDESNNIPYCTPIRDQGQRGTCVSFGSVSFLEFEFINHKGYPQNLDLSEQFFFWACKQRDGFPNSDGTSMTAARDVTKYDGACLERTWPYNPYPTSDPAQGPPPSGAKEEAEEYTIQDIDYIRWRIDLSKLKNSLKQRHIAVFAVPVYASWYYSEETKRTGEITMPVANDKRIGGHCMALVGYKDDADYPGGGYFILRNSWGTDWAYESLYGAGYGTIPYAYIKQYWQGGWVAS
ncbi:MAG TPA: C1 family peptidase [Thermoplasmata archaeon]|nr:C1 family peptidase [Thermoplasmata archaeon]